MSKCPCCSGMEFEDCCSPFLNGEKHAPTAEALMRSRYSAFAKGNIEYLRSTLHPKSRSDFDESSTRAWSRESEWKALEIVSAQKGAKEDNEGSVEFIAQYVREGKEEFHHEAAEFARADGKWYFVHGKLMGKTPYVRLEPKIGRNDACSCGSGKKYKKCCGK